MEAIGKLSLDEKADFYKRLHGWDYDEWDKQMIRDLEGGRWDKVLAEVDRDIAEDRLMDMP